MANRTTAEFAHRRGEEGLLGRGWIAGVLWTSQTYDPAAIREEVLTSVFRAAHIAKRGPARTLREILLQEGNAMRMAGARNPALEPQTLLATRQILLRLLDHDDTPTLVAALFGDPAARELGYQPLGLRPRAGLALALHGRLEAPQETRQPRLETPASILPADPEKGYRGTQVAAVCGRQRSVAILSRWRFIFRDNGGRSKFE